MRREGGGDLRGGGGGELGSWFVHLSAISHSPYCCTGMKLKLTEAPVKVVDLPILWPAVTGAIVH